jgi:hypothetical protein
VKLFIDEVKTDPDTHDTTRIDDTRIKAVRPLITPALLQEWLPTPDAALALVERSRAAISRVLHGQDDRLIVVVGPCSIHDHGRGPSSTPRASSRWPIAWRATCSSSCAPTLRSRAPRWAGRASSTTRPRRQLQHQPRPARGARLPA